MPKGRVLQVLYVWQGAPLKLSSSLLVILTRLRLRRCAENEITVTDIEAKDSQLREVFFTSRQWTGETCPHSHFITALDIPYIYFLLQQRSILEMEVYHSLADLLIIT